MSHKQYRKHTANPWELEPYYCRHVGAMTEESLHSKAEIAEELAVRDVEIERLRAALAEIRELPGERLDESSTIVRDALK